MSEKNNTPPEIIPGDRHQDYKGEITALLRGNLAPGQLRNRLEDYHERDIAEALELLRRDERCRLYALLDAPTLAGVLEYTEDDMPTYLEELGIRKKLEILPLLDPSTAADYLKGLERAQRSALVDLMEDDVRRDLSFLSSFDEDEIGSRMTTDFVSIRADMTVRQAMKELIRQAADTDNISTLYAVDANGVLVGAIDLKELIIARETTALDDILMTSYPMSTRTSWSRTASSASAPIPRTPSPCSMPTTACAARSPRRSWRSSWPMSSATTMQSSAV